MPLIENSTYKAPLLFKNSYALSIFPSVFRKVNGINYTRERITTPDNDFIDLDWSRIGSDKIVILSHGLEGNSNRPYMEGMIKAFNKRGWDGVSFNFRGCGSEINKKLRFYHSGTTDDLHTVVCHVADQNRYSEISLVGFSLGGNLTLKYTGEQGGKISSLIKSCSAISVPCDLRSSALTLAKKSRKVFMNHLLKSLFDKLKQKNKFMPDKINIDNMESIKTFKQFDDRYIAPVHGFKDAEDYWAKCSCKKFFNGLAIPSLIINALDDPFLGIECYPFDDARDSKHLFLETPERGGHMGFVKFGNDGEYWHETRVTSFVIDGI